MFCNVSVDRGKTGQHSFGVKGANCLDSQNFIHLWQSAATGQICDGRWQLTVSSDDCFKDGFKTVFKAPVI